MFNLKNAEADPWKVIAGMILIILFIIIMVYFFTDKFSTGEKNFDFNCVELEIPGRCVCPDPQDCNTQEGKEECAEELRRKCNER